ncbi:alpha/beta hydrolase [Chachezhania antarctica]|uniref:alpha/beta hydrolase n=1 Tax=Chachezhania antarctica TaxID=2340860 RepID=UPI000EAE9598|nr:alpha/beta hydrolase [Chachezhania antarctica]|tara:strand:+ start:142 stop:1401 length:1260 start_codon:yes stop_codon:yes gene_type:complete
MGNTDPVRHRKVFYIPGYDPIHARRYRELYRREGAEQARISGYGLEMLPKAARAGDTFGWSAMGRMDGAEVRVDVDVLEWSDIVKGSMEQTTVATYRQLAQAVGAYVGSGILFRLMKLRKGPVIAALYPVAVLLGQLLLVGLVVWGLNLIGRWTGGALSGTGTGNGTVAGGLIGLILGGVAAGALFRWFKRIDNRLMAYYLMHDYAFSARFGGANPPELEARMARFADRIAEALAEDGVDEVLVVGHSSGAHVGVSLLADLLRAGRVPDSPALNFLTLGQVVPMVSFLPRADRLRRDLAELSVTDRIAWVDVSAPGDGCAFALCDPVSVTGVAPEGKRWPLVISCAFTQTLSPERWNALKRRFFRLHFQYLCAFDRPGDYDYFRITAGPLTLRERFAGRPPSKSRIETPVSPFTSQAGP